MPKTTLSIIMGSRRNGEQKPWSMGLRLCNCSTVIAFFLVRYGFWYRPEISATGTSANTAGVAPINIEVLQSSGNVAHSNGASVLP